MRFRALVLMLGGLPVSGAIVGAFLTVLVLSLMLGPPLSKADLISGAVFVAFALTVVAMALRVFLRVRREGAEGAAGPEFVLLAKVSPVLIALGLGGGVWFGWTVSHGRAASDADAAAELCAAPALLGLDAATCARELGACRKAAWAAPIHDHNDPEVTRVYAQLGAALEKVDDVDARRPYTRMLERLTSSYEVADFDRPTLVCLARLKR